MRQLEVAAFIAPHPDDPNWYQLKDPITHTPVDVDQEQPYASLRQDPRMQRGRDFWDERGPDVDLTLNFNDHDSAEALGTRKQFEGNLRRSTVYGFEFIGGSAAEMETWANGSPQERDALGPFMRRVAEAVRERRPVAVCYDVPQTSSTESALTATIDRTLRRAFYLTPEEFDGLTNEQLALLQLGALSMRDHFIPDNFGDQVRAHSGQQAHPRAYMSIGARHEDHLLPYFVSRGVSPHVIRVSEVDRDTPLVRALSQGNALGMISAELVDAWTVESTARRQASMPPTATN